MSTTRKRGRLRLEGVEDLRTLLVDYVGYEIGYVDER